MLVLVDFDDDATRHGVVEEIRPVSPELASDGFIVNGVVEVGRGFQQIFDFHLAGLLMF